LPIPEFINPQQVASFWDQARIYKDQRIQRGKAFCLLMAKKEFMEVIVANNMNAASIYNKLKKEVYAMGASDLINDDAKLFVQAGRLMENKGDGYFR